MGGWDVAQDAAGADRGELLVVADEPDAAAAVRMRLTTVSRERVSAMPASSMMTRVLGSDLLQAQSGRSPVLRCQASLARVSVVAADLFAEPGCGDGGGGEADHGAAGVGPGAGEGVHGGGLAGPGGCDRELQPCAGGGHVAHEQRLGRG